MTQTSPVLPPKSDFLIEAARITAHSDPAQTDTTELSAWKGESEIETSQVQWLPGVTTPGAVHRPYPSSGEHAIFSLAGIGLVKYASLMVTFA